MALPWSRVALLWATKNGTFARVCCSATGCTRGPIDGVAMDASSIAKDVGKYDMDANSVAMGDEDWYIRKRLLQR